jgi:hypothetical protein
VLKKTVRISLTTTFVLSTRLIFAIGVVFTPVNQMVEGSSVIVVGTVNKLSPSEFIGHWTAPQAFTDIQITVVLYGKHVGKKIVILTDDNKKLWPQPTDVPLNFVKEGKSYLFFLTKNEKGQYIPFRDGVRELKFTNLSEVKRYVKEIKGR